MQLHAPCRLLAPQRLGLRPVARRTEVTYAPSGDDDAVAAEAASTAAKLGTQGVTSQLRATISRPGGEARIIAAIRALAKLGDRDAVPSIAARLADAASVRGEASLALDQLVGPPRAYTEREAWAREKGYVR